MEKSFKINKDLYSLESIYSVSSLYLDKMYIFLNQDNENIIVSYKPKINNNIENFEDEFKNQLLDYIANKNKPIINEDISYEDDFYEDFEIDDPEGILIPWEEKYKKEDNKP
jgi:His-Xaa-Ser system protein HxsD